MTFRADIRLERGDGFALEVEFEIADETLVVVGPNGAGKSTLLRCLAGLEPGTVGSISLKGERWLARGSVLAPDRRPIGMVFQKDLLLPHLNVAGNVELGTDRDPGLWLERLDVAHLWDRYPGDLSGGERQRVAIARAFARLPRLMLMDEPLSAVDAERRPHLRRLVKRALDESHIPAVVVSHDPTEAATMGHSVLVMEGGKVTQRGTVDELRSHPRSSYVAELVGINLYTGVASDGSVEVADQVLVSADHVSGDVYVTIHPRAVSLHRTRPEGSPRNSWLGRVESVDRSFDLVRLDIGGPVDVTATVTPQGLSAVGAAPGAPVWVSVKASEVRLQPR